MDMDDQPAELYNEACSIRSRSSSRASITKSSMLFTDSGHTRNDP